MENYDKLNRYLADMSVLNAKLHNLHWNVECSAFKQVHEYVEGLYDYVMDIYDSVAELMKMQGVFPLVKLADFLKVTGLEEIESRKYSCREVWEIILKDLEYMKNSALVIRGDADKADNFLVVNEMEDHVSAYAKYLWFIRSSLG